MILFTLRKPRNYSKSISFLSLKLRGTWRCGASYLHSETGGSFSISINVLLYYNCLEELSCWPSLCELKEKINTFVPASSREAQTLETAKKCENNTWCSFFVGCLTK